MARKTIEYEYDKEAAWNKVKGRIPVFLDTNCWVKMRMGNSRVDCRIRDRLKELVSAGNVFCPLSWGLVGELVKQTPESRQKTATLMEELSLNVCYAMRREAFHWEIARSIQRQTGRIDENSLCGLYVPISAHNGSQFIASFSGDYPIEKADQKQHQAIADQELGGMGLVELMNTLNIPSTERHEPPAYSKSVTPGQNKKEIFAIEAANVFKTYVMPFLATNPDMALKWSEKLSDNKNGFPLNLLSELPALHNYTELMTTVYSLRKDKDNHFFDYEIMPVPLAYAAVFVAEDGGIEQYLRQTTEILKRTKCHYCENHDALESWLERIFPASK